MVETSSSSNLSPRAQAYVENITSKLKQFNKEEDNEIQYNKDQLAALKAIKEFKPSTKTHMTLIGAAGTGKTTLLKEAIKNVGKVSISAPTHKAKLEAAIRSGASNTFTLAELLGLNPDVDIADFDPHNPAFAQKREPKIGLYNLNIVDEASMVNKELYNLIIQCAEEYSTQVLFIGDACQLPPVKELENSLALQGENVVELHTIIRQSTENPLTYLLAIIRYLQEIYAYSYLDTKEKFDELYEIITRYTDKFDYNELYSARKNMFFYIINKGSHIIDGKGFVTTNSDEQFYKKAVIGIPEGGRILAFTNACVSEANQKVRDLLGYTNQLEIGELVTAYKTLRDDKNNMFLTNSLDYIIKNRTSKISVNDIDMIRLELEDTHYKNRTYVDLVHPLNYDKFKKTYDQVFSDAKTQGKWPRYFQFKDAHALMSFNNKGPAPNKGGIKNDLEYGYGLTIHKSQGSTYTYVYVKVDNIYKYCNYDDSQSILFSLKLLYVAISRATNVAVLKF